MAEPRLGAGVTRRLVSWWRRARSWSESYGPVTPGRVSPFRTLSVCWTGVRWRWRAFDGWDLACEGRTYTRAEAIRCAREAAKARGWGTTPRRMKRTVLQGSA